VLHGRVGRHRSRRRQPDTHLNSRRAVPPQVAEFGAQVAAGPQPPPGKAPLTIADLSTISQREAVERMDEIEGLERREAS
jgi:hypothetical protein